MTTFHKKWNTGYVDYKLTRNNLYYDLKNITYSYSQSLRLFRILHFVPIYLILRKAQADWSPSWPCCSLCGHVQRGTYLLNKHGIRLHFSVQFQFLYRYFHLNYGIWIKSIIILNSRTSQLFIIDWKLNSVEACIKKYHILFIVNQLLSRLSYCDQIWGDLFAITY